MHKCIAMYIFIKSSFPKHDLRTGHCHCNLDFLALALETFWKRALPLSILTLALDIARIGPGKMT